MRGADSRTNGPYLIRNQRLGVRLRLRLRCPATSRGDLWLQQRPQPKRLL